MRLQAGIGVPNLRRAIMRLRFIMAINTGLLGVRVRRAAELRGMPAALTLPLQSRARASDDESDEDDASRAFSFESSRPTEISGRHRGEEEGSVGTAVYEGFRTLGTNGHGPSFHLQEESECLRCHQCNASWRQVRRYGSATGLRVLQPASAVHGRAAHPVRAHTGSSTLGLPDDDGLPDWATAPAAGLCTAYDPAYRAPPGYQRVWVRTDRRADGRRTWEYAEDMPGVGDIGSDYAGSPFFPNGQYHDGRTFTIHIATIKCPVASRDTTEHGIYGRAAAVLHLRSRGTGGPKFSCYDTGERPGVSFSTCLSDLCCRRCCDSFFLDEHAGTGYGDYYDGRDPDGRPVTERCYEYAGDDHTYVDGDGDRYTFSDRSGLVYQWLRCDHGDTREYRGADGNAGTGEPNYVERILERENRQYWRLSNPGDSDFESWS